MKRVLHILGGLKRGGIETFLINLYKHIDKNKIQFDFLVSDKSETSYSQFIKENGGRIYYYIARNQSFVGNIKSLNTFFKQYSADYDTVHYHCSSLTNIVPLVLAKKYKISRRIIHSHNIKQGGSSIHSYLHSFHKLIVSRFATNYFACSFDAAKWMFPKFVIEASGFKVIPNGINIENFSFSNSNRQEIRQQLGILNDEIIIGNVARFHTQKNHLFMIDTFHEIFKKNKNYRLVLVGKGDLYGLIRKKVTQLGLDNYVIFYGESDNVSSLMSAFDIFLMPSLYEGLGIVLIEAQASNLYCVVSKDVIPIEAKVSSNYLQISLAQGCVAWANDILNLNLKYSRNEVVHNNLLNYDIHIIAKNISDFYLNT